MQPLAASTAPLQQTDLPEALLRFDIQLIALSARLINDQSLRQLLPFISRDAAEEILTTFDETRKQNSLRQRTKRPTEKQYFRRAKRAFKTENTLTEYAKRLREASAEELSNLPPEQPTAFPLNPLPDDILHRMEHLEAQSAEQHNTDIEHIEQQLTVITTRRAPGRQKNAVEQNTVIRQAETMMLRLTIIKHHYDGVSFLRHMSMLSFPPPNPKPDQSNHSQTLHPHPPSVLTGNPAQATLPLNSNSAIDQRDYNFASVSHPLSSTNAPASLPIPNPAQQNLPSIPQTSLPHDTSQHAPASHQPQPSLNSEPPHPAALADMQLPQSISHVPFETVPMPHIPPPRLRKPSHKPSFEQPQQPPYPHTAVAHPHHDQHLTHASHGSDAVDINQSQETGTRHLVPQKPLATLPTSTNQAHFPGQQPQSPRSYGGQLTYASPAVSGPLHAEHPYPDPPVNYTQIHQSQSGAMDRNSLYHSPGTVSTEQYLRHGGYDHQPQPEYPPYAGENTNTTYAPNPQYEIQQQHYENDNHPSQPHGYPSSSSHEMSQHWSPNPKVEPEYGATYPPYQTPAPSTQVTSGRSNGGRKNLQHPPASHRSEVAEEPIPSAPATREAPAKGDPALPKSDNHTPGEEQSSETGTRGLSGNTGTLKKIAGLAKGGSMPPGMASKIVDHIPGVPPSVKTAIKLNDAVNSGGGDSGGSGAGAVAAQLGQMLGKGAGSGKSGGGMSSQLGQVAQFAEMLGPKGKDQSGGSGMASQLGQLGQLAQSMGSSGKTGGSSGGGGLMSHMGQLGELLGQDGGVEGGGNNGGKRKKKKKKKKGSDDPLQQMMSTLANM